MSSEIYELMKRSDEAHVVEKAHRRPRFVEDCVREMIRGVVDAFPELNDAAFVSARQVNLETIHQHNVVAERFGTLGEVRRELETACRRRATRRARPGSTRSSPERRPRGQRCAPSSSNARASRSRSRRSPTPSRARTAPPQDRRLRGVPHRSAPARPRDRGDQAPGRARPSDRRHAPTTAAGSACPGSAGPTGPASTAPADRENLCLNARFTGRDIDGGYAEWTVADERYCLPLPDELDRRAGGAAPVRRADRLPLAADDRRRAAGSGCTGSARPPT